MMRIWKYCQHASHRLLAMSILILFGSSVLLGVLEASLRSIPGDQLYWLKLRAEHFNDMVDPQYRCDPKRLEQRIIIRLSEAIVRPSVVSPIPLQSSFGHFLGCIQTSSNRDSFQYAMLLMRIRSLVAVAPEFILGNAPIARVVIQERMEVDQFSRQFVDPALLKAETFMPYVARQLMNIENVLSSRSVLYNEPQYDRISTRVILARRSLMDAHESFAKKDSLQAVANALAALHLIDDAQARLNLSFTVRSMLIQEAP